MQKNKIIEKNMSIEEASAFWDEHDIFEFNNVKEVKDIQFKLKKKKYIGVSYNLYKKLNKKAKEMHKSCESLIEDWLKERMGRKNGDGSDSLIFQMERMGTVLIL